MGQRLNSFISELAEGARSIGKFDLSADLDAYAREPHKSIHHRIRDKPINRDHAIVERIVRALETGR